MTPSPAVAARPRAHDNDVDALVAAHLPLAQYAVNTVTMRAQLPPHVSRDDLVSAAQVALVEAARRYDPTLGATFATYASNRLQGAVLDELRAADWASRSVRARARRMEAAVDALTVDLGRPPSNREIADRLGVSPDTVAGLQTDVHRAVMVSIDIPGTAADRVTTADSPEGSLLGRERTGYLLDAIDALPDRLGEVIERNFFDEDSLTDIAEDLGVTLSRVSQMRAQALSLLGAALGSILDEKPVEETGGSRARAQRHSYIGQVATASADYRTRLARVPVAGLAS